MLYNLLKTTYSRSVKLIRLRKARLDKRRSERALNKLDDHLLDDVGLRRDADGSIVSIKSGATISRGHDRTGAKSNEQIVNKRLYFARRRL
ncbi:MAG: DUF1127 domain-containing protein [Cellvibrionaceae bacterium]